MDKLSIRLTILCIPGSGLDHYESPDTVIVSAIVTSCVKLKQKMILKKTRRL